MKQQFAIGEKAVYPVHGVAEVVAMENRDIGGAKTAVYILKILETGLKIMVPTANAATVAGSLRRLAGCRIGRSCARVYAFTGLGASLLPRPAGRSGCVTTVTTCQ